MANLIRVRKHQGQAVIGAFALTIILTVTLIYLFNIGTAYSEKTKLADAADAAVYAQAATTAKRLNFAAYTNRAMAVNHLAVGHTISYLSWIRYLNDVWETDPDFFTEWDPNEGWFGCLVESEILSIPCIAHPNPFTYSVIDGIEIPFFDVTVGLREGFLNGVGYAGSIAFPAHELNVLDDLREMALNNPGIFDGQADAFANAIAVNRTVTNKVVESYVQNPRNPIRINGCALDDPTCAGRNNDVQNAINLANQLGQNNLALMLNDLLPAAAPDPIAGNITLNEQSTVDFASSGAGTATAIKDLFEATQNAHPSREWISNRTWSTEPPPSDCDDPVDDVTGCRFKTGGTLRNTTGTDGDGAPIYGDHWTGTDEVINYDTGVTHGGQASTLLDIVDYTPFPGGFSLPDAVDGSAGPETDELFLQLLLSQNLLFTDWDNREVDKGRRKLALHVIDEDNPLQETNVFDTETQVLTAYAQAKVFYDRPVADDGAAQWFAELDQPSTEYANLYNPFWQAKLIDQVLVNF